MRRLLRAVFVSNPCSRSWQRACATTVVILLCGLLVTEVGLFKIAFLACEWPTDGASGVTLKPTLASQSSTSTSTADHTNHPCRANKTCITTLVAYELPNYVTDEVLKIAILADIHVLGERKRSALDVWWTDIQVSQKHNCSPVPPTVSCL